MTVTEDFFRPWESKEVISDWTSLVEQINRVLKFTGDVRTLAWRGLSNASYPAHSTLYRRLAKRGGAVDEKDLVEFEKGLLATARKKWRYDDRSALELLAQLQHLGGPTRLLDVTFNPLIAVWFSVEQQYEELTGVPKPDVDGRLLVYDVTDSQIELDEKWGGRDLPWATAPKGWQNELPRVWRPPSYNERIPAQDSAFLLAGVPKSGKRWYRKAPGDSTRNELWPIETVRDVTSVPMRIWSLDTKAKYPRSVPTLTIRVPALAKANVRTILDKHFGINTASVYPDLYGLARHGANIASS